MPISVNLALQARRRRARIKLVDMAAHLSISAPYLYDLERGHRRLSEQHRLAYEQGLATLPAGNRQYQPTAGLSKP